MEDWQEWQIRADAIASQLGEDVDTLQRDFFTDEDNTEVNFRSFWPRFRDLKERVRVAPAIRLEAKLDLERRLRQIGARAYRAQEAAQTRSGERKEELLASIAELRSRAERESSPRVLRSLRREFDVLRQEFDAGAGLMPADRQSLWEAWRDANQAAWQRLTDRWVENETELREILNEARGQLEKGNPAATRQTVGRFFEVLKSREGRQETVTALRGEADAIRREANEAEERKASERMPTAQMPGVPALDTWRAELARNQETLPRLQDELAELERRVQDSSSILEQAMIRGTLVEKKRKVTELERANRSLAQKIEASEESPLIPTGS